MAKVELKQPVVQDIAAHIKDAESVILVNYSGLTVEQDTILRKELREAGIFYKVYKNTMMNFAFEGTPCESLREHLNGTNAIVVSKEDATAGARVIAKYAKQYPALEMIAGVVEGNYMDSAGIQEVASVPSREELIGKLLGSIQSPIANFARVISQIAEQPETQQREKQQQAEEPKVEEPQAEEPKAEETKAEEPKAEEPQAEEPKAEEPKAEEPQAEEAQDADQTDAE